MLDLLAPASLADSTATAHQLLACACHTVQSQSAHLIHFRSQLMLATHTDSIASSTSSLTIEHTHTHTHIRNFIGGVHYLHEHSKNMTRTACNQSGFNMRQTQTANLSRSIWRCTARLAWMLLCAIVAFEAIFKQRDQPSVLSVATGADAFSIGRFGWPGLEWREIIDWWKSGYSRGVVIGRNYIPPCKLCDMPRMFRVD